MCRERETGVRPNLPYDIERDIFGGPKNMA